MKITVSNCWVLLDPEGGKQFHGPLEGTSTHWIAIGNTIRIVDVTMCQLYHSTMWGFTGRLLLSQKFTSAGGGSMLACKLLICPSKLMQSNLPLSSPLCHPFSVPVVLVQSHGRVFSVGPYCPTWIYFISVQVIKKSWGWKEIVHKYSVFQAIISASEISNSCVCCSHVVGGGVWVSTQVHSLVICIHWFITEFVNFDAEMFSFLWNSLPKDNPALELNNYLVHCQILRGVIEFSISLIQFVKDSP